MTADVLLRQSGRIGHVTLNRPASLNALTHQMIRSIAAALDAWETETSVELVVIDADGPRAFCAGGDLRDLHASSQVGPEGARAFWRDEYRLNARIAGYRKPVLALMQGIVMGGGVGLGCHASCRIVGETTRIALPECSIGLVPDVGSTLLLGAAPGRTGEYLGLTGAAMNGADAIFAGFADLLIPEEVWPDVVSDLLRYGSLDQVEAAGARPASSQLSNDLGRINDIFSATTPAEIADRARPHPDLSGLLSRASPLSLAATLWMVRQARQLDRIEDALEMEFRFTSRAMVHGDFREGIRARVIEKGSPPVWRFPDLDTLDPAAVEAMLAPVSRSARVFGPATPGRKTLS